MHNLVKHDTSEGAKGLLGGGSILENNIVQTGASAGSSIAAGVIFTIPALVIMGYWPDFKYWCCLLYTSPSPRDS